MTSRPLERVLVFGATSAIAQAFARRLAARGARLHLVARDAAKLDAVRSDLLARGAAATTTSIADLDDTSRHRALIDEAEAALGTIDAVLIAQGSLPDQAVAQADFEATRAQLATNFLAPVSLLTELANRFEARRAGTLAVISSVAGDRGRKTNYVYGSAKGALSVFLEGLRGRLHESGVAVVTVKPGFVDTPMTAHIAKKGALWASADTVAAGIVRAMERGAGEVYLPKFWWAILFILRHLPEAIFIRLRL